jgi:hypothetical protein
VPTGAATCAGDGSALPLGGLHVEGIQLACPQQTHAHAGAGLVLAGEHQGQVGNAKPWSRTVISKVCGAVLPSMANSTWPRPARKALRATSEMLVAMRTWSCCKAAQIWRARWRARPSISLPMDGKQALCHGIAPWRRTMTLTSSRPR